MSRILRISQPKFSSSYIVSHTDDNNVTTTAYHAKVSELSRSTPAISLRAGAKEETAAPVIAVCHVPNLSQNYKIGLGDPGAEAGEAAVQWEDMRALNWSGTEYGFYAAAAVVADPEVAGQTLVWKHTRRVMVDGEKGSAFRAQSWKLVDNGGRVLAVFTGAKALGNIHQCGALQINVDWGNDFETMAVIMCLTLYEKEKREVVAAVAGA